MSRAPTVLWAQRVDRLLVSIQLEDVTDEEITVDNAKLAFSGKSHDEVHSIKLEFFDDIIPEESKQRKGGREYYFDLKKKEPGPYWPRLLKEKTKHSNIKVDFNRWKDEDESDDEVPGGMSGMPGGMGGMPGGDAGLQQMMQQMGGMGGQNSFDPAEFDEEEDSDDEDIPSLEDGSGKTVE